MLRAAALARRDALDPKQRAEAANALAAGAFPLALAKGAVVAGYWPIRSEFDPRPLMHLLAARGARLALPVIVAPDAPLVFRLWAEGDALEAGPFGIHAPPSSAAAVEPDMLLVPLAAFDRAGHRIGYGAGHYDRTLAELNLRKQIVTLGLAFAVQEIARVPGEAHDMRLSYVLTEREMIDCRGD